jgi:hypothetical protein
MSLSSRTRITLQNVMLDVDRKRPGRATAKAVFDRTTARWAQELARGANQTDSNTASASLNGTLDALPSDILCLGPSAKVTETVSRIIDRGPFETHYLRPGAFGHLTRPNSPLRAGAPARLKPAQVQRRAMFTKPLRNCYWVTKSSVIDGIVRFTAQDRWATRVRDHLGLQHYREPVELIEIIYPKDALMSARVAVPTFLEGACNYVYRSQADDVRNLDTWGRAVDLEFPHEDDPAKLAPEAVHVAIEFNHGFTYRHLGSVKGSRRCSPGKLHHPRPWRTNDPDDLRDYTS